MRSIKSLLAFSLLLPLAQTASANDCPLPPIFSATYEVKRNGRTMGEAVFAVESIGNQRYRYSIRSAGTRGMASMLGASIEEVAVFEVGDETTPWLPNTFEYERKIAISSREESSRFNWNEAKVHGKDRHGKPWTVDLEPGMLDPLVVNLALINDLCKGATSRLEYQVVKRGRVDVEEYVIGEMDRMRVRAGVFRARMVSRDHGSDRETSSWHSPVLQWLPIRLKHKDGSELLEMELKALPEIDGARITPS